MKIGIIGGTGNLGFGLAVSCSKAGYEVWIGSRTAEKAQNASAKVKELVPEANVFGFANEKVAEQTDVLILSIPFAGHDEILGSIKEYSANRIILDTTVPLIFGKPPKYNVPAAGSAAENVQRILPEARVVSGLHTVAADLLANPNETVNCDAFLCGDDPEAKETITKICADFGLRVFDVGPLTNAQSLERLTPLIIGLNQKYKKRHIGIKLSGL